ncbi:Trp biosynthesis-associated membrane protein [Ornithinimicrobium sp. F0845]|uniref:Trp biosynthesis-associated membrane protein n=1 Tax=Ornithinimicrobium sp. F0845 TaxID=2926412 RepID=UPI001FF16326|nr:Trp biosynthesis-associated membrane protein [Ornithinimicrobium sp. F0845]MCK0113828.1 Trp biosynthesis-associated membrane protein [Ornithinimicrobium sp. F0845]
MRRWWLWAALGVALLLVGSGQTWATGTAVDSVLGGTRIEATGTQAGATLVAGALLAGAALLAGLVGTRPVRLASALCLAAAALLAGLPAIRSLTDPAEVITQVAADLPGLVAADLLIEDAAATIWPWVALIGAAAVLLGAGLCLLTWLRGPSTEGADRASGAAADRRSERPTDAWDDLSRGHDPTVED